MSLNLWSFILRNNSRMKKTANNICISLRIKLFGIKNSSNNINKKNILITIEISFSDFLFFFNNLFIFSFDPKISMMRGFIKIIYNYWDSLHPFFCPLNHSIDIFWKTFSFFSKTIYGFQRWFWDYLFFNKSKFL